jgi:REP element-mobilizing transposase RayT
MARPKRLLVAQDGGSMHITSRVVGREFLLGKHEKEYFLKLLKRFSAGFFIRVHAFCIMSNHFHIMVTWMSREAALASKEELLERYKLLYPKKTEPPEGAYDHKRGQVIPDDDEGIERLRRRLGSVSDFVRELKQTFTKWYNKRNNREGYFWSQRYKSVAVSQHDAQAVCSSYIDLNPVRAGVVKIPEDYRWSSLGLRVRSKAEAANFLFPISLIPNDNLHGTLCLVPSISPKKDRDNFILYRELVYKSGGVKVKGKASIPAELVEAVVSYHGRLGILDRCRYRVRNFSEGLAFGSYEMIASLQEKMNRKYIRPRPFIGTGNECTWAFSTRVLSS